MTESMLVELYWLPGCTSCLRMKEFVERSGVPFEAINVDGDATRAEKVQRLGLRAPVACVGERCVPGGDLKAVAGLIGIPFEGATMLPPAELVDRYGVVLDTACRLIVQMTPEILEYRLPGRARSMMDVADHIVSKVMRCFLAAYYENQHATPLGGKLAPAETTATLLERADATRQLFLEWWQNDGWDDPLDRVVQVKWGHATLHEILEKDVWHSAQHVRQLALALEQFEIEPHEALTDEDLRGLPVPDRVHD